MKIVANLQGMYGDRMIFQGGEGSWYSAYLDQSDRIRIKLHRSMQECNMRGKSYHDNPNIEYCSYGPASNMEDGIKGRLLSDDRDYYREIDLKAWDDMKL